MNNNIIWTEDMDVAYGVVRDFKNSEDFIKEVKNHYLEVNGEECEIEDCKIQACISTGEGISPETIMPLFYTDVVIENYYIADVYEVEK